MRNVFSPIPRRAVWSTSPSLKNPNSTIREEGRQGYCSPAARLFKGPSAPRFFECFQSKQRGADIRLLCKGGRGIMEHWIIKNIKNCKREFRRRPTDWKGMERANLNELQTFPATSSRAKRKGAPCFIIIFFNVWDNHEMDGEIRKSERPVPFEHGF